MNFEFVSEKCSLCGQYTIRKILIQYFDFSGLKIEQKKMCTSCNAVFDLKNNLEDIAWSQPEPPQA